MVIRSLADFNGAPWAVWWMARHRHRHRPGLHAPGSTRRARVGTLTWPPSGDFFLAMDRQCRCRLLGARRSTGTATRSFHSQLGTVTPEKYEQAYYASATGSPSGDVASKKTASFRDGSRRLDT